MIVFCYSIKKLIKKFQASKYTYLKLTPVMAPVMSWSVAEVGINVGWDKCVCPGVLINDLRHFGIFENHCRISSSHLYAKLSMNKLLLLSYWPSFPGNICVTTSIWIKNYCILNIVLFIIKTYLRSQIY